MRSYLLIIGAQKSGTSTLHALLAQHPALCPGVVKEVRFFSHADAFGRGPAWYEAQFPGWDPAIHQWGLDATVLYTNHPKHSGVPERILEYPGRFKFVYILRDPVSRVASDLTMGVAGGWTPKSGPRITEEMIGRSMYASQIRRFYDRFPGEDILLAHFDDLKSRPRELLAELCRFVGLADDFPFDVSVHLNTNKDRIVEGEVYKRLRKLRSVDVVTRLARMVDPDRRLRKRLRSATGKRLAGTAELTPDEIEFVMRRINDDILSLQAERGFDITRWPAWRDAGRRSGAA